MEADEDFVLGVMTVGPLIVTIEKFGRPAVEPAVPVTAFVAYLFQAAARYAVAVADVRFGIF